MVRLFQSIFSRPFCILNISIRSPFVHLYLSDVKFSLLFLSLQLRFSKSSENTVARHCTKTHTPDVVLSVQCTSLSSMKNLCFRSFFLGVLVLCWPCLLHSEPVNSQSTCKDLTASSSPSQSPSPSMSTQPSPPHLMRIYS